MGAFPTDGILILFFWNGSVTESNATFCFLGLMLHLPFAVLFYFEHEIEILSLRDTQNFFSLFHILRELN